MSAWWWQRNARAGSTRWFVQRRADGGSRTEAGFRSWVEKDTQRARAYEDCELAWELAGVLEDDQQIRALTAELDSLPPAAPRRIARIASWSAAACLLLGLAAATLMMRPDSELYATAIGEQRWVVLPDRSRMSMNTDTRVRVTYGRRGRQVQLERGEATFEVSHDPSRPFEVQTGDGIARALGTRFNVRTRPQGVTVAVLDGTVEVRLASATRAAGVAAARVLRPGEEVTYTAAELSAVREADTTRIQAWHSRRIVFDDMTLGDALAEFNLYTPLPVSLADPALAAMRVSGTFRIGELEALLNALQRMFPLRIERRPDGVVLHVDGDLVRGEPLPAAPALAGVAPA